MILTQSRVSLTKRTCSMQPLTGNRKNRISSSFRMLPKEETAFHIHIAANQSSKRTCIHDLSARNLTSTFKRVGSKSVFVLLLMIAALYCFACPRSKSFCFHLFKRKKNFFNPNPWPWKFDDALRSLTWSSQSFISITMYRWSKTSSASVTLQASPRRIRRTQPRLLFPRVRFVRSRLGVSGEHRGAGWNKESIRASAILLLDPWAYPMGIL